MHKLKRRLYKRASSYEITIPKTLLWNLDLTKKHEVIFSLQKNQWEIKIQEQGKTKPSPKKLIRKLYKRGHSLETTLPLPLLLHLNPEKNYNVVFSFAKNKWLIDFEEIK